MDKMPENIYYMVRHLKNFRELTRNNNDGIWCVRWIDGKDPEVFNDRDKSIKFTVSDIHMAEYIASMNNFVMNLIEETESKYGVA